MHLPRTQVDDLIALHLCPKRNWNSDISLILLLETA